VVAMVALGSVSMIHFPLSCSESEFKLDSVSFSLSLANNDCFERNSSMLFQGILLNSHHSLVSFFDFPLPFCYLGLESLS
jgi:hypothetical protein